MPRKCTDTLDERIRKRSAVDSAGCWIWQGGKARNGYGSMSIRHGVTARAHRVSFEAFNGPIPSGMNVCHRCDVRACVNPEHLFLGTQSDNIRDAYAKGRANRHIKARGTAHPLAKLSDEKVREILFRLRSGEAKASIGRRYGVSDRIILLIHRGQAWAHVSRVAA